MYKKLLTLCFVGLMALSATVYANPKSDIKKSKACVEQARKFYKKSDLVNTEKKLKEAIQLDDKNDEAYFELGNLELFGKVFDEALVYYTKAISINPKNDMYYLSRGTAKMLLPDLTAIEDFNKSIELNPKNELAYFCLGKIYCNFGYFEESLEYLNKSIQYSNGKDENMYIFRAGIKMALKDYNGAISDYKKALTIIKKQKDEQYIDFLSKKIKLLEQASEVFK